ncbi:MAG TPA: hypothetical protein VMA31_11390 [Bryobacteraceae bacterium]|nr:hypothetical protein [Bryobacteraceae bacterium]
MNESGENQVESGATRPVSRSRFRGPLRLFLVLAVLAATLILIFPLVFGPRVDVPAELEFGNPSSVFVQISNQNLTPLQNVDYTCELSKLTLANGSEVPNENVLVRGAIRKIDGRSAAAARCQAAYLVTSPLQAAEYKLTLTYQAYPWKRQRTSVYPIVAKVNAKGEIIGWKLQ